MREFQCRSTIAVGALFVGFVGWSLYGAMWPVETYLFRMVHMAFVFGLAFLAYPIRSNAGRWTIWPDLLLALLGVASIAYACLDTDSFVRRTTLPEPMDLFFGIAAILLLLEISRRIVGNAFTLVVTGFLIYMYFGKYFPDVISHKGYDLDRIVGHMIGETDMVVATPLPWGPPNRADVITAPRPALDELRPIVASERSSQKPPAPAASMKVP